MNIRDLLVQNERELKAIIYRDEKNNLKTTYRDFDLFQQEYREDEVIKVYKPTKEQRKKIEEIIISNMKLSSENNEIEQTFSVEETYELMDELTTLGLKLDLTQEKDKEFWNGIVQEPSELMWLIQREIKDIATFFIKAIYSNMTEFMDLPEGMKDSILALHENKQLKEELTQEEIDYQAKQKEIEELTKQLEEKKAELMK